MGMVLEEHGDIIIEVRRESFIVHDSSDGPHPEYLLTELVNLRDAANEAIEFLEKRGLLP